MINNEALFSQQPFVYGCADARWMGKFELCTIIIAALSSLSQEPVKTNINGHNWNGKRSWRRNLCVRVRKECSFKFTINWVDVNRRRGGEGRRRQVNKITSLWTLTRELSCRGSSNVAHCCRVAHSNNHYCHLPIKVIFPLAFGTHQNNENSPRRILFHRSLITATRFQSLCRSL